LKVNSSEDFSFSEDFHLNASNETASVIGGKPAPGLERRYPEADCLVQAPDKTQRIERAGMLPARGRVFFAVSGC
jgi:hypothetical protein